MTRNEKTFSANEPYGSLARQMVMKHFTLIIHVMALTVLFSTLAQPYAIEKPAGVRRAIETVGKKDRGNISVKYEVGASYEPAV